MLDTLEHPDQPFANGFIERDLCAKALGIEFSEVGRGHAAASMLVRAEMTNALGTCHGGVIFTLADTVFAAASNSNGRTAVAQFCSIAYLRPAAVGDRLTAVGRETIAAGQRGIYDITVSCGEEIVAAFRGHARTVDERAFSP